MLKFESIANVGDKIKAFDFQPMPGRPDNYLVGRVIEKGQMFVEHEGRNVYLCDGYKVYVTDSSSGSDKFDMKRIGTEMIVPFEMSMMDFDDRISVVEAA
jgi:hypothetical protein